MDYRSEASKVNQQSLASTQRMRQYLSDADDAAISTMANLETQGEQLSRMEDSLDKIDKEVRLADQNLTQLDKCCGLFVCPWKRSKNLRTYGDAAVEVKYSKHSRQKKDVKTKSSQDFIRQQEAAGDGRYIQRITGDSHEEEMEENMESVSSFLQDLKLKAKTMGTEIESQNETIDRLNVKVVRNKENIERSDQHAAAILRG